LPVQRQARAGQPRRNLVDTAVPCAEVIGRP
jgi:hypothetical protein